MLTPHQDQFGANGLQRPLSGLADVLELGDEVAAVSMGDLSRGDAGKPVFSPSRSGVLRQEVTLAIEKAILLGAIAPGQRLVESDVANQMGISKAPVREALRSLEQLGLVVNRPRRGTFVTPVTATLAGEAFSLRALLETYAARLAVHNVQESHLTRMREYLEHAADVWDDYPARIDFDLRMHDVLFELSGHKLLQQAWGNLRSQVQLLLTVSGILRSEEYGRGQPRSMVIVHEPIMNALRDRDAARVEREIVAHLAEGERRLRLVMDPLGSEPYVRSELFTRTPAPDEAPAT
jgi:DNA-binding GntR family transcriptional regulator